MTDIFDDGNAAVFDFESIAAYVNRKPQPEKACDLVGNAAANPVIVEVKFKLTARDGLEADNDYGQFNWSCC